MRELLLPVISVIIGIGFLFSGYLITVKKRYDMMTDFYMIFKKYENFPALAKRHGIIELAGGGTMLALGVITSFFGNPRPAFLSAFFGTIIILLALKLNKVFSKKNHYH